MTDWFTIEDAVEAVEEEEGEEERGKAEGEEKGEEEREEEGEEEREKRGETQALWARTTKNTDCSTGPLTCPFARLLVPPTRPLTHYAHSLAHGTVNDWMAILCVFFSIFDHTVKQIQFCCSKILDRLSSSCFAD